MTPFEYLENIFYKTKHLSDEELKDYSVWVINKFLASSESTLDLLSVLNAEISPRKHYDFLYFGFPKKTKKVYNKYLFKKEKDDIHVQYISEFFSVSQHLAKQYIQLISNEELKYICDFYENRGVYKMKKTKEK